MKKTVHIVLETGSLAGGVRVVGEFANRLMGLGWPVEIWSVNPKSSMSWFDLDKRIKWHDFLITGTTADYEQLANVLRVTDGFKMATFWRTAPVVSECSATGDGIYLIQDIETSYAYNGVMGEMIMDTYDLPLHRITTSQWVKANLEQECDHVGIGINSSFFKPDPNTRRLDFPLACARPQALKGWSMLGEVTRMLNKRGKKLKAFGLPGSCSLIGFFDYVSSPTDKTVRALYRQAGCFISTSQHEGFSLSPLEAMACGCPTVVTNSDGNMEYAVDEENCLIENDPVAMSEKIVDLILDQPKSKRLREAGYETSKRYKWTEPIEKLSSLLESWS